tara:strand:+ start:3561 stop:3950 length:390 start_codon:yes stop_codon:yes gene_type:complete
MARISNDELGEAVFKPSPSNDNEIHDKDERDVVAYTTLLEEVDEDASSAYAKTVRVNGRAIYYVKQNKYGKLYNPNGMYSEGSESKQLRHAGRPNWVFRDVDKKVFDYYLKFLETKNEAWLNNAERELV